MIELLLAAGGDVNGPVNSKSIEVCKTYNTALQFAAAEGHPYIVQALIDNGADVSRGSLATGFTALDCARKARQDAQKEQVRISLDEVITILQAQGGVDSSSSHLPPIQDDWFDLVYKSSALDLVER